MKPPFEIGKFLIFKSINKNFEPIELQFTSLSSELEECHYCGNLDNLGCFGTTEKSNNFLIKRFGMCLHYILDNDLLPIEFCSNCAKEMYEDINTFNFKVKLGIK